MTPEFPYDDDDVDVVVVATMKGGNWKSVVAPSRKWTKHNFFFHLSYSLFLVLFVCVCVCVKVNVYEYSYCCCCCCKKRFFFKLLIWCVTNFMLQQSKQTRVRRKLMKFNSIFLWFDCTPNNNKNNNNNSSNGHGNRKAHWKTERKDGVHILRSHDCVDFRITEKNDHKQ